MHCNEDPAEPKKPQKGKVGPLWTERALVRPLYATKANSDLLITPGGRLTPPRHGQETPGLEEGLVGEGKAAATVFINLGK